MARSNHIRAVTAAACAAMIAVPASGRQPADPAVQHGAQQPVTAMPIDPAREKGAALPERLDPAELGSARARATIVINQQQIDGVVQGNSLGDFQAGEITLSDNAFSNFSGVGNFLFNTGAQNNLQAGMVLTITVEN